MKTKIALILGLVFWNSVSLANINQSEIGQPPRSEHIVKSINDRFPGLQLKVGIQADEGVLLNELEVLEEAISGRPIQDGELIHFVCCSPACGGGC